MPQAKAQVVRKPLSVRERSSRPLDARLAVRFPRLLGACGRLILRLPPTSRVRQAALWRSTRVGMEAFNRRDFDAAVVPGSPDFELYPPREFVAVGFDQCYRGREGFRKYVSTWSDALADIRVQPVELIDLGDRVVLLAELPGRGQASGVPFTGQIATVSMLREGRAVRVDVYVDHGQALDAVGLPDAKERG
jgi:ketosteroid isomerase-like protein